MCQDENQITTQRQFSHPQASSVQEFVSFLVIHSNTSAAEFQLAMQMLSDVRGDGLIPCRFTATSFRLAMTTALKIVQQEQHLITASTTAYWSSLSGLNRRDIRKAEDVFYDILGRVAAVRFNGC